MFALYLGWYPAIFCPVTGEFVVVYKDNARGFQECLALLREVATDIEEVMNA